MAEDGHFVVEPRIRALEQVEGYRQRLGERGLLRGERLAVVRLHHVGPHAQVVGEAGPVVHVGGQAAAIERASVLALLADAASGVVLDDDGLAAVPSGSQMAPPRQ